MAEEEDEDEDGDDDEDEDGGEYCRICWRF